jgi:hypothetical protein
MQSSVFSTAKRPFHNTRDKAHYSQLIRVCAIEGKLSWHKERRDYWYLVCSITDPLIANPMVQHDPRLGSSGLTSSQHVIAFILYQEWGKTESLRTAAPNGSTVPAPHVKCVWNTGRIIILMGEKSKRSEENLPQCLVVHHKSNMK